MNFIQTFKAEHVRLYEYRRREFNDDDFGGAKRSLFLVGAQEGLALGAVVVGHFGALQETIYDINVLAALKAGSKLTSQQYGRQTSGQTKMHSRMAMM